VRGSLLERWRAARAAAADPVAAFAEVAADGAYRGERGRGGFVRCDWEEAVELIAAATVHAIREHGPDRVAGFTPIPAMSPVSFTAGTRFLSLIGGHTTTFYDWYADLPPASPQVFGDQTDVPESADWWDWRRHPPVAAGQRARCERMLGENRGEHCERKCGQLRATRIA
jgi:nitrate reductase alpha subunit